MIETEHQAQAKVFEWMGYKFVRYPMLQYAFAVPNGAHLTYRKTRTGKRYSPEANKLKSEGMRPGVPDLMLPWPNGDYCGLFIEMKVGSNKPSEEQEKYIKVMNLFGYLAVVCYGSDKAIETIAEYVHMPKDDIW